MALSASAITVAATATQLNQPQADGAPGSSVAIMVPAGGVTVFIGGATVTATGATQGWPVAAGESLFLDLDERSGGVVAAVSPGEVVYAIVASGTQLVNVLARGV